MAFEFPGQCISLPTTQNLSAQQYRPVWINASGNAVLAGTVKGAILGILQNTPSTGGGQCTIMVSGVSKIYREGLSTAIGEGAALTVLTTIGGIGVTTAKGFILGRALTAATTLACYFSALLNVEGVSSTYQGITQAPS